MRVNLLFRFVVIKLRHCGKPSACIEQLIIPVLNLVLCLVVCFAFYCISAVLRDSFLANVNSRSRSLYVIARPSVCHLSVTFVRPTQAIEIFSNVSTPFGTVAIC